MTTTDNAQPLMRASPRVSSAPHAPGGSQATRRPARRSARESPTLLGRLLPGRASHRSRDAYRRLAMQLDVDLGAVAGGHVIMLTSADSMRLTGEATVELAELLADELDKRVLIIDGSFSKAGLTGTLGHGGSAGLREILSGQSVDGLFRDTGHGSIAFLPSGDISDGATMRLAHGNIKRLLVGAAEAFDYVLIASGSVLEDSRCLAFTALADRVLMLAVERRTLLDDLRACRKALEDCGARKIGLVLTKSRRRLFGS